MKRRLLTKREISFSSGSEIVFPKLSSGPTKSIQVPVALYDNLRQDALDLGGGKFVSFPSLIEFFRMEFYRKGLKR